MEATEAFRAFGKSRPGTTQRFRFFDTPGQGRLFTFRALVDPGNSFRSDSPRAGNVSVGHQGDGCGGCQKIRSSWSPATPMSLTRTPRFSLAVQTNDSLFRAPDIQPPARPWQEPRSDARGVTRDISPPQAGRWAYMMMVSCGSLGRLLSFVDGFWRLLAAWLLWRLRLLLLF